jgi:hypothetical protein
LFQLLVFPQKHSRTSHRYRRPGGQRPFTCARAPPPFRLTHFFFILVSTEYAERKRRGCRRRSGGGPRGGAPVCGGSLWRVAAAAWISGGYGWGFLGMGPWGFQCSPAIEEEEVVVTGGLCGGGGGANAGEVGPPDIPPAPAPSPSISPSLTSDLSHLSLLSDNRGQPGWEPVVASPTRRPVRWPSSPATATEP